MNRNGKHKVLVMGFDPENTETTQTNVTNIYCSQKIYF